jgi:hypothetical protein
VLQANFLSLSGTAFNKRADRTSPLLVAVLGSNTQTMSTFVSTQNLMMGLLGAKYGADAVAQAVVAATYRTFKAVDPVNAASTLTNKTHLVSLYSTTYQGLTGASAVTSGRHLLQSTMTPAQLQNIFGAVANTVSATNTQVQQLVNTATVAAADPTSTVDTSNLMLDVSKMATVQQNSLASDITELATTFAANPSTTPITTLEDVSATVYNSMCRANCFYMVLLQQLYSYVHHLILLDNVTAYQVFLLSLFEHTIIQFLRPVSAKPMLMLSCCRHILVLPWRASLQPSTLTGLPWSRPWPQ